MGKFKLFWIIIVSFFIGINNVVADGNLQKAIQDAQGLSIAPMIERDVFLRKTKISQVQLSPNGNTLAFLVRNKKVQELWVFNLAESQPQKLFSSTLINEIYWSMDGQNIFIESRDGVSTIGLEKNGFPNALIELDRKDEEFFLKVDQNNPHHFYVSLKDKDTKTHNIFRADKEGQREFLFGSEEDIIDFLTGKDGNLRFFTLREDLKTKIFEKNSSGTDLVYSCSFSDNCGLVGLDEQQNSLYLNGRFDRNLTGLAALNLATGKINVLHEDPRQIYDVSSIYFDKGTNSPLMVRYSTEFLTTYGLTGEMSAIVEKIESKIQSKILMIRPNSSGQNWLAIDFDPSKSTPHYYIFNIKEDRLFRPLKAFAEEIYADEPKLASEFIAPSIPIEYKASDGFQLYGYVTLPRGVDLKNAALIVNPHGGPWNRTEGAYDSFSQFLANRGYIVFQPNFRASIGYGKNYYLAANKDFGNGRVQADIIEGVEYLLSQGTGNRDRLGIWGHSFGGFATLTALAYTPDMFQVGVAGAPPVSLSKLVKILKQNAYTPDGELRQQFEFAPMNVMKELLLDDENPEEVDRLYKKSPDYAAANITKPLLIMAGKQDPRVSILNVREFSLKLKAMGKDISLLVAPNEGHSYRHPVAQEAYFYQVEKTFGEVLGNPYDQSVSSNLALFLKRNMELSNGQ